MKTTATSRCRQPFASGLLFVLLLLAGTARPGRAQGVQWASGHTNATQAPNSTGRVVATDAAGNTYWAGTDGSLAAFADLPPAAQAGTGLLFVLKRDPAGRVLWLRRGGASNGTTPLGIGVDGAGTVVLAGTFTNSATFGSTTLTSAGGTDAFVTRLSPAGSWLTAVRAGGSGADALNDLEVRPDGTAYVTGSFIQAAAFGALSLNTSTGASVFDTDIFVARLSPADVWQWATRAGGPGPDVGQGLAADAAGRLTVTGTFRDTCSFGGLGLKARPPMRGDAGSQDLFVAQLDAATGTWQWATRAGGIGSDDGFDVAVDNSGTISLGGAFVGTIDFGDSLALPTLTSRGAADMLVARLSAAGTWLWANSAGGSSSGIGSIYGDKALTVRVDPAGTRTTVGGLISGTAYFGPTLPPVTSNSTLANICVAQADNTDGHWLNAAAVGTVGQNQCRGLALSPDGHVYMTGLSTRTVYFNEYRVASPDYDLPTHPGFPTTSTNIMVAARLQPNTGTWDQVLDVNQGGSIEVLATAHDAAGNAYVAGRFDGMVDFATPTPTRLVSTGWQDAFIGKLDAAGRWLWVVQGIGPVSSRCEAGQGIAVDAAGRVTVAGYFESASFSLGGHTVSGIYGGAGGLTIVANLAGNNTFVAQLDGATGAVSWLRSLTAASNAIGFGLSLDPATGEASVAGTFRGTLRTTDGSPLTATATSAYDGFVARLDLNGNWRWLTRAGGTGAANGSAYNNTVFGSLAQDASGAYTISGLVQGTSRLGTITLAGSNSVNEYYPFIARLNAAGTTWLWAQRVPQTARYEQGFFPAKCDAAGAVYWPISPGLRAYTATGSLAWQQSLEAAQVAVDAAGDLRLLGSTSTSPTTVAGMVLTGTGQYMARLSPAGAARWVGLLNGTSPGTVLDVVDAGGTLTAAGFGRQVRLAAGGTVPVGLAARLLPPPEITSFTPGQGNSGLTVVLTGLGFTDASAVAFNGTNAPGFVVSNGGTTITVAVPFGASTGPITVSSAGGLGTSATPFVILLPDLVVSTPQDVQGDYNNVLVTGPATGGAGTASLTGPLSVAGTLTVQNGGTLLTMSSTLFGPCNPITGPGSFVLAAGGTLGICHPEGISRSGPTGAVQLTGPRSYSSDAYYRYTASENQVTGPGLPDTVRELQVDLRRLPLNSFPGRLSLSRDLALRQALRLLAWPLVRNGHSLTLLSGPAGTALVEQINGSIAAGPGLSRMQRYISPALNPGPGYRHLASPLAGGTVGSLFANGATPVFNTRYNTSASPGAVLPFPTLFGYDQGRLSSSPATGYSAFDKGWYVPDPAASPQPLQGFTLNLPAPALLTFEGDFFDGASQAMTLSRGPQADAGWWLLGNPYPAPFDLSAPGAVTATGVEAAVYVFESTGQYSGAYRAYVNGLGTGSPLLPAAQGFFVRADAQSPASSYQLNAAGRVTTFAAQPALLRGPADARPCVALALRSGPGPLDEVFVYAEAGATAGPDVTFDAHKILNPGNASLYAVAAGGEPLAIQGLPGFAAGSAVPLTVQVPAAGPASFTATLANLPAGLTAYLTDAATGTRQNLSLNPGYRFTAARAGSLPGRFALVFGPANGVLATAAAQAAALALYPNPARSAATLSLPATAQARPVQVLDALGRVVRTAVLPARAVSVALDLAGLPAGVYLVRCSGQAARLLCN